MHLYIITSDKFTGQIELLYINQQLAKIDFRNAQVNENQIAGVKAAAPPNMAKLSTAFEKLPVTIMQGEFDVSFDMFWKIYPYKRNKHLAEEYWGKMDKTNQVLAWQSASDYATYCERHKNWYNPKIADTWLKKKEYLNEWKKL